MVNGIDMISLEWFQNYLHGRSQCVRVNNVTPERKPYYVGVPPMLYAGAFVISTLSFNTMCKIRTITVTS